MFALAQGDTYERESEFLLESAATRVKRLDDPGAVNT